MRTAFKHASSTEMTPIDEPKLSRWFERGGSAYRDLLRTLDRVAKRGWVLTNPGNPSTKRLIDIQVKELRDDMAVVRTTAYWYL